MAATAKALTETYSSGTTAIRNKAAKFVADVIRLVWVRSGNAESPCPISPIVFDMPPFSAPLKSREVRQIVESIKSLILVQHIDAHCSWTR